jgi:hypothetical protein
MLKNFFAAPIWGTAFSALTLAFAASACAAPDGKQEGKHVSDEAPPKKLPYARGKSFDSLDAYLLYLQTYNGPIDLPYWRPVGGDRFEHVRGRMTPPPEPEFATREELMERFGFEK